MKKILITALMFTNLVFPALGCGASVTGKVSIKGNEPFTYAVITDETNTQYRVKGDKEKILREKYQGKTVKAKGTVTKPKDGEFGTAEIVVTSIDD